LAALGFAQLVMVVVHLVPDEPKLLADSATGYRLSQTLNGLGTGGVGGTAYATDVVRLGGVPSATLGWLAGLACVVVAVAGWYWFSLRPRPGRFVLATLGALAAVPLLDLVGFLELRWPGDVRGTLLATLGLIVLAAYERSWFVVAVAGVSALVALVFPPVPAGVLCSAGVLLAAAFAALLWRRGAGPVTAADTP
jgi:hypothetical protein